MQTNGLTSVPLRERETRWIASAEVFPAKIYPLLGDKLASPENDPVFGGRCTALSATTGLGLSSLKTYHHCCALDLMSSSVLLPDWGTMRAGELYQQQPPACLTREDGYTLLPTPLASDGTPIVTKRSSWVRAVNGLPRRMNAATDGTFSAGLARLTELSVFLPLIPHLSEALMTLPIGWTELERVETP